MTPQELMDSIGGPRVENYGNPRVRLIRGDLLHSVPEGELEQHSLDEKCPCKPHLSDGVVLAGLFLEHHHLGPMPNPTEERRRKSP